MADDFSFLTDSDDERAVEDVLSQAMDHSVLEQIAAINCSSFSTADNLPTDLENRFRKLKSLPTTTATTGSSSRFPTSKSKSFTNRSVDDPNSNNQHTASPKTVDVANKSSPSIGNPEDHSDGNRDQKKSTNSRPKPKSSTNIYEISTTKSLKSKSGSGSSESRSDSSSDDPEEQSDGSQDENKVTNSRSKVKHSSITNKACKTKSSKSKSGTRSPESRSDSWNMSSPESDSGSVTPARRGIGCLWCSPKKEKRKQGKENRLSSSSSWRNDDDVDFLKTFSKKEQKKIMKKVMKEEEKINREAEKIVKWAKQASARMIDVSGLDDELDSTR
ncbi:hypothetical protein R6Q59_010945 [Mikania micrantha]|uniref:Uncharacterized protein n=1 Tax=Mikania micrantha TaxID=192012 RepID=A0A5N6N6N1_9ASTR|nr:hypothetical protein E3N88_25096 [Mikania micrantha]